MRSLAHYALSIGAAALFAGCGGSESPIVPPGARSALAHVSDTTHGYSIVYDFDLYKGTGTEPLAAPLFVGRDMYTTTSNSDAYGGAGTVVRVTENGAETTLYTFRGGRDDGAQPQASLIDVQGTFYGTTRNGGGGHNPLCDAGCGTVYSMSSSGAETILHRFNGPNDGAQPTAPLLYYRGKFYGTASLGGTDNQGIVFALSPSGKEHILHRFTGFKGTGDGAEPSSGLVQSHGLLYGMTTNGGKYGQGTVYKITPSGNESVIYSFKGVPDGVYPEGDLVLVNGKLYGTSLYGGSTPTGTFLYGCGTVFSVSTSGQEHVLHRFEPGGADGCYPHAGKLVYLNESFYGTTGFGGKYGSGTVFAVTLKGKERVLHSFDGYTYDGQDPSAGVVLHGGELYGTTRYGGSQVGGTIYRIKP